MKISIITVCYNSAATLATAIESVLDQTYQDIEYIVVDGGSKDGTVEIIRKYADEKFVSSLVRECVSEGETPRQGEADPRRPEKCENAGMRGEPLARARQTLSWISEPDEGMYDAINKGIRLATGDVIGILNADDFLADDGVIERVANTFLTAENTKNAKIDVVYGDVRFVRAPRQGAADPSECANAGGAPRQGESPRQGGAHPTLASLRSATTLRYYSAKRWKPWMLQWGYMPPHPGVYIRRELFEKWGTYKLGYHIAADYELLIRYLRKQGLNMRYLNACIVGMRPGGKSTKNWRSNLLLNQEIVRGNRENGYFCCMLMLAPKYVFKIFEFIVPWAKGLRRGEAAPAESRMNCMGQHGEAPDEN